MGHGEAFNSNVLGVSSPKGTHAPFYSQATETEMLRPDSWSKAVFNAIHNAKETSKPPISPQNTRPGVILTAGQLKGKKGGGGGGSENSGTWQTMGGGRTGVIYLRIQM